MQYGPTTTPTRSPLGFDGDAVAKTFWDCGLPTGGLALPRLPKVLFDVETQEGLTASVLLPGAVQRVLVTDPGREIVREHHGVMTGTGLGDTLGVYAVTEQRGDGLVVFDTVVHNGICDPLVPSSWPGCLRFKKIRIRLLTPGFEMTPVDCGAAGDWYFGIRTAFCRRFVVYPAGDEAKKAAALRLAARADLKIPDAIPRGSALHPIPRLLEHRKEPLWNNTKTLGPFHFDTVTENGYDVGDAGIDPVGGWEGSEAAALSYDSDVTRIMSRHGVALADRNTGEPVWPGTWPKCGGYKLFDDRYSVDPWNWPSVQGTIVGTFGWNRQNGGVREKNPGACANRDLVLAYKPHDCAHLGRVISRAQAAWQLCRSWSARWLLRMNAVDVMTSWAVRKTVPSLPSLDSNLVAVQLNPHAANGPYLREEAWIMEAIAGAMSLTPIGPERDEYMYWRAKMLDYVFDSCLWNGFARAGSYPNSDNGVPWQDGLPTDFAAVAVFQVGIWANAAFDLLKAGQTEALDDDAKWLVSEAERRILMEVPHTNGSPPSYLGVARNGQAQVPVAIGSNTPSYQGHFNHDHHGLAIAWLATGRTDLKHGIIGLGPTFPDAASQLAAWRANPTAWSALPIMIGGAT